MSLATAIRAAMDARGLRSAEVANRMVEAADNWYDRATFYRLLSGATRDPRLGTLITLCTALEISPTELVRMAGVWPHHARPTDPLDLELRAVFAHMLALPIAEKERVADLVAAIAKTYSRDRGESDDKSDERITTPPS